MDDHRKVVIKRFLLDCEQLNYFKTRALMGKKNPASNNFRKWFMQLFRRLAKSGAMAIGSVKFWSKFGVKEGDFGLRNSDFEAIWALVLENPNIFNELAQESSVAPDVSTAVGCLAAYERSTGQELTIDECVSLLRTLKKHQTNS